MGDKETGACYVERQQTLAHSSYQQVESLASVGLAGSVGSEAQNR